LGEGSRNELLGFYFKESALAAAIKTSFLSEILADSIRDRFRRLIKIWVDGGRKRQGFSALGD
jgi:hypothetical protein